MTEPSEAVKVQYYEFGFETFMADAAEQERAINEVIYDLEDAEADSFQRLQALGALAMQVNQELNHQGILGHEVATSTGIIMPSREALLQHGITPPQLEESEDSDTLSDPENPPFMVGAYAGVTLIQHGLAVDGIDHARSRICHKILLASQEISNAFIEQSTSLYGYQPIDNEGGIQILKPGVSYLPNEKWLRSVTKKVLAAEVGSPLDNLEANNAFKRIIRATRSKVAVQKNLDWYYDQLAESVDITGQLIEGVETGGFLVEAPSGPSYVFGETALDGVFLSFGPMATYELQADQSVIRYSEDPQLAMIFEALWDGEVSIVKVPVKDCPNPE